MKVNEVPQDDSSLSAKNIKEVCYAVDEKGNYTTQLSQGWKPKSIALTKSLELIDERAAMYKQEVIAGKYSPIIYYMEMNRMDMTVLAGYMGLWKWTVKRHFKPRVFKSISQSTLNKYANLFNISLAELKDVTL